MTGKKELISTTHSFEKLIAKNGIYVDKTEYLVKILESGDDTWFLARPRRFGKSLTVSSLESVLSNKIISSSSKGRKSSSSSPNRATLLKEKRKLFDGLAIQNKLREDFCAPRPVIKLDMSYLTATQGIDEFEMSLRKLTVKQAKFQGIKFTLKSSSNTLLSDLIEECSIKNNSRVAILIDEYDSPITKLLDKPAEMHEIRERLREYYSELKVSSDYTSLVFVTGITKFVQGGLFTAFNNPTDITIDPDYGAIAGFTHEEIIKYFPAQIRETAEHMKISEDELIKKLKSYYEGFCFDGKTKLYNPVSIFSFFRKKRFSNYWFNTGISDQLIPYIKKHKFNVNSFSNIEEHEEFIESPSHNRDESPASYFFQLGLLSLQSEISNEVLILNYPNTEVKQTMDRLILSSFFESPSVAKEMFSRSSSALLHRDPASLIKEINRALSTIPYTDYPKESNDDPKFESFYRSNLVSFFSGSFAIIHPETQQNIGRPDIVLHFARQTWVVELKISHSVNKDKDVTAEGKKQMLETNYGGSYRDPVLLAITINSVERQISSWWSQGGLSEGPDQNQESEVEPTKEV
jgi:hypothetical protein